MGSSISKTNRANKDHLKYDQCRKKCWETKILPELTKLHINSGSNLKDFLKASNITLEISCPDCISIKISLQKDLDTKYKCKRSFSGKTKCRTALDIDDEFKIIVTDTKINKNINTYTTESSIEVYNIIKAIYGVTN